MQGHSTSLGANLAKTGLQILHSGAGTLQNREGTVHIIGHAGSSFWPFFKNSAERMDRQPDPLDRWSRRVICAAAPHMHFTSPNDGPPFAPIHALAQGGSLHPSPLGMMVHVKLGLWTAVRGLLVDTSASEPSDATISPCEPCAKPCLSACPVDAFTGEGFDALACSAHLSSDPDLACHAGCLARRACPVAPHLQYQADHAQFYMDAFVGAMARRAQ